MANRLSALILAVLFVTPLFAALSVNVRDFGAIGDGIHDDTLAIQRAADALYPEGKRVGRRDHIHFAGGWTWDGVGGEVFFPKGTYKVSGPVMFQYRVNLRGEPGAVVRNVSPEEETFYFHYGYFVQVEHLAFEGGFAQLRQWTRNASDSLFFISDCSFSGASGTAIISDSWRPADGQRTDYDLHRGCPPCEVARGEDGRVSLKRRDPATMVRFPNSTQVIVENCRFTDNTCAFDIRCDGGVVRDCAVDAVPGAAAAARVGSCMHLNRVRFLTVRDAAAGKQCAVVSATGTTLCVSDCTFASRGDVAAIESGVEACRGQVARSITLKDVTLDNGDAPVIRFAAGTFPNMVIVDGLTTAKPPKSPKLLFAFEREPTAEEIARWPKENSAQSVWGHPDIPVSKCIGVEVSNVKAEAFDATLPPALEPFRRDGAASHRRRVAIRLSAPPDFSATPVLADNAIGKDMYDGEGDDAVRVQSLFDKAAAHPEGATVMLPPKWIRLGKTINVAGRVHVLTRGRSIVTADDGVAAFRLAEGADILFENVGVHGGEHAIACDGAKGTLRIRNCGFYVQKGESILAAADGKSAWRIEMTGGSSMTPRLYRGNANPFLIDAFWHSISRETPVHGTHVKTFAAIVNLPGGVLVAQDVLGVPGYFEDEETYHAKFDASQVGDYSWAANHGEMALIRYRFGGEHAGLTPLYHYDGASSYVEGNFSAHIQNWRLRDPFADACVFCDNPDLTFIDVVGFSFFKEPSFVARRIRDGVPAESIPNSAFNCYPYPEAK